METDFMIYGSLQIQVGKVSNRGSDNKELYRKYMNMVLPIKRIFYTKYGDKSYKNPKLGNR